MDDITRIFSCRRCGFCCQGESTVSLDGDDRRRMAAALGSSEKQLLKTHWRVSGPQVQMKTVDGHCIFFEDGCTVHQARPWRCAQWPLVPALLVSPDNYTTISESCPGINKDLGYEEFCRILSRYLTEHGVAAC